MSKVQNTPEHDEIVDLLKTNIKSLDDDVWEIVEIQKTHRQVVGGMKYYATGIFKHKGENSNYKATFTIYTRPWENFIEGKNILT